MPNAYKLFDVLLIIAPAILTKVQNYDIWGISFVSLSDDEVRHGTLKVASASSMVIQDDFRMWKCLSYDISEL